MPRKQRHVHPATMAGDSTLAILAEFSVEALSIMSGACGQPISILREGLLGLRARIAKNMVGRVVKLNLAFAVARHLTQHYVDKVMGQLHRELAAVAELADVNGGNTRQGFSDGCEIEKSGSPEAARFGTVDNDFIVDAFLRQLGGIAHRGEQVERPEGSLHAQVRAPAARARGDPHTSGEVGVDSLRGEEEAQPEGSLHAHRPVPAARALCDQSIFAGRAPIRFDG